MIRKASDFDREVVPNMCGGEGDVVLDYAFHGHEITSKVTACCTVTLAPGASVGPHTHPTDDEIYYIISGQGEVIEDDGKKVAVGPGDAILTGNGGSHQIANIGRQPLVFLAVVIDY